MSIRVRFRIRYTRRSELMVLPLLALLGLTLLGIAAWDQPRVVASAPQAPAALELRRFYVTPSSYNGADADAACAVGYHMASLWEVLDPSGFRYNTNLGYTQADSGQGPPTVTGWVRTGYLNTSFDSAGAGNCNAWASDDSADYGTYAGLPTNWTAGQDVSVWQVNTSTCDLSRRVWCVENLDGASIYLPMILKDR